jgi:PAS domain S-box-containing protein
MSSIEPTAAHVEQARPARTASRRRAGSTEPAASPDDTTAGLIELLGAATRAAPGGDVHSASGWAYLRALLEQWPAALLIAEAPSGRLLGYSRRAAELWGGPLPLAAKWEEYAGQFRGSRLDGSLYESSEFPLARALRWGETVHDEEIEIAMADGSRRVLLTSAAPIRDETGTVRTAVTVMTDVTARTADERRREFAARLADLLHAQDDADALMRSAIVAISEHLGVSGAALLEFDSSGERALMRAECRNGVACVAGVHTLDDLGPAFGTALREGRILTIEDVATSPIIDPAGRETFATLDTRACLVVQLRRQQRRCAALLLLHDGPREWRGDEVRLATEAAERTWTAVEAARADSSLRKSEEWLRVALRAGSAAAWEWDLWTDRVAWSAEHHELLGADAAHPISTVSEFLDILHDDDRERTRRAIARIGRVGGSEIVVEFRIIRRGVIRWIRAQGQVLLDRRGRPARAFGVMLDVTAQKEAELEREALLTRLEEASAAKSNFISVMSHEFRTPLTSVIGYADLLESCAVGPLNERQTQQIGRIKASAWHLTQVIDEVLTFSRIEAGREDVQATPLDCCAVARDSTSIIEPSAQARGLVLRCETPRAAIPTIGDEGKLRQILINLLGNAVKFTDEGEIALRVSQQGDHVCFEVQDTGIGIAPENVERIFERFWQVNQGSTRSHGGTGLGLTVTRRLAELLGGTIEVHSELGKGSRFRVRLPIRRLPKQR